MRVEVSLLSEKKNFRRALARISTRGLESQPHPSAIRPHVVCPAPRRIVCPATAAAAAAASLNKGGSPPGYPALRPSLSLSQGGSPPRVYGSPTLSLSLRAALRRGYTALRPSLSHVADDSSTVVSLHRPTQVRGRPLHRGRRQAMSEQPRGYAWDYLTASKLGHRCRRCMG